jgi:16S rRNA (uracil1498-N3)-methyltransferase
VAEPRFFVDMALAARRVVALPAAVAHHARHVLRLRPGAPIVLFDGRGGEYRATLGEDGSAEVVHHVAIERESPLALTLLQGWIATDKLEWVVEKAVELGAARIALAPCGRSVVRLEGARLAKRVERLREVAVAACCQSGRNRIPAVQAHESLATALDACRGSGAALLLDPGATEPLLDAARAGGDAMALAVGPEGGFEPDEVALAERAGYRPGRLGPRVLRTETAGLAALAALQSLAGDLR